MNFSREELKELATESNWLKLYSITTGRMVEPLKIYKVVKKPSKAELNEVKSGIVYEGELTTMGKSS